MVIIQLIPSENAITRRVVESNQAFYLAQSGLQKAFYLINNSPDVSSLTMTFRRTTINNELSYTITYTNGLIERRNFLINNLFLGEYVVSVTHTLARISSGGFVTEYPLYRIISRGFVPSLSNSRVIRTIEVYGFNREINLSPFRFAVYAGRSVDFSGVSAVIEGARLPNGSFDTAIYSNGPVDLRNPPLINGTRSPRLGIDVIANDSTLTMPVLNETYLKAISQSQGLYASGKNIDLRDIVNKAKLNANWYNAATNTWRTWSLVIYIDGSADMAGNVEFQGMVIVKGDVKITGTGNKIRGILYAASVDSVTQDLSIFGDPIIEGTSIGEDVKIGGNSTVRHNRQFIENIFQTHGLSNVIAMSRTKLIILSWQEN